MTIISDQNYIDAVNQAKVNGRTTMLVSDHNDNYWNTGFAAWLMDNFKYENHSNSFVVYLLQPKTSN